MFCEASSGQRTNSMMHDHKTEGSLGHMGKRCFKKQQTPSALWLILAGPQGQQDMHEHQLHLCFCPAGS